MAHVLEMLSSGMRTDKRVAFERRLLPWQEVELLIKKHLRRACTSGSGACISRRVDTNP